MAWEACQRIENEHKKIQPMNTHEVAIVHIHALPQWFFIYVSVLICLRREDWPKKLFLVMLHLSVSVPTR